METCTGKWVGLLILSPSGGWWDAGMSGGVWLPESSLADGRDPRLPAAEREKRKKAKITKRTTPTVEFRAESSRQRQRRQTYSTIESSSYSRRSLHLLLNDSSPEERKTELCGWETEREQSILQSSSAVQKSASERADGQRSRLQSRAEGRPGKSRKNSSYEFKHLPDPSAYLQDYCARYSHSALVLSREHSVPETGREEKEDKCEKCKKDYKIEQQSGGGDDSGYAMCLVKSRAGGERRRGCLEQLASRLGVTESIQEGQLRYRPRPTPPSFTRRPRVAHDILVSTQDHKQESTDTPTTPVPEQQLSLQSREEVSRGNRGRPQTTDTALGPLELPRLPPSSEKNKKTLSTSSVGKYLKINSRAHHTLSLGLGEEESAVDGSSHDTLPSPASKTILEEDAEPPDTSGAGEEAGKGGQQSFLLEDVSWRERVLAQKARALGLLSRDWGQARLVKRVIAGAAVGQSSRPCTRGNSRPHTRARSRVDGERDPLPARRPYTRGYQRVEGRQETVPRTNGGPTNYRLYQLRRSDEDGTRPATSHKDTSPQTSEKLEKLRTIYEPVQSKRSFGQQQRREKGTGRRPATRCGEVESCQREREKKATTRPGTRAGKRVVECDGSQYWSEVPRIGRYVISHTRTHLRAETQSTGPANTRPLQRVRLFPTSQSRQAASEQRTPSIELSGHLYRHRNRYSISHN